MKNLFIALAFLGLGLTAHAGLTINAAEIGVGKFHRYDKKQHPAEYANNPWGDYALPDGAGLNTPQIFKTADNKVTIVFSTLEELLTSMVKVSQASGQKISVLNMNAHGMPGSMWFPKDENDKKSAACSDWRTAANGDDVKNYEQYYEAVSWLDIMVFRIVSFTGGSFGCTSGGKEWVEVASHIPNFKSYFSDDLKVHFASCLVALGRTGKNFTSTVANVLLPTSQASLQALTNLGLGDWSMPEGIGFWDFHNFSQLNRDNRVYSKTKRDRDIMQKGTVRLTYLNAANQITTSLIANQTFVSLGDEVAPSFPNKSELNDNVAPRLELTSFPLGLIPNSETSDNDVEDQESTLMAKRSRVPPARVHIPGTGAYVYLKGF